MHIKYERSNTMANYLLVATESEQALLLMFTPRGLHRCSLATIATSGGWGGVVNLLTFLLVAAMHHILDLVHSYQKTSQKLMCMCRNCGHSKLSSKRMLVKSKDCSQTETMT